MRDTIRLYRFDDVIVQPEAFRVEKSGRVLTLEPKAIRVLLYLIEHRSRAVGKEELLREVWGDVAVTDNALTRVVAQLRREFGDDAKVARYIETIPTLGYRFVAQVTVVTKDPGDGGWEPKPPIAGASLSSLPMGRRAWARIDAGVVLALGGVLVGVESERWRSQEPPVWSGSLLGGSAIASHPRISPDGQLLAFRAIVDGDSQVAVMKPDAASWTVITHDRDHGSVATVAWAPDGSQIYFDRERGSRNIYVIRPLGGESRLLLENAGWPESLPDGSLIVLRPSAEGREQLLRYWPDSGRLEQLPATVLYSDTRSICPFPDGKEIAVSGFYGASAGARRLFALDPLRVKRAISRRKTALRTKARLLDCRKRLPFRRMGGASSPPGNGTTRRCWWRCLATARKRARSLLSLPFGATPLACDVAPDGSIYMDHSSFQSSVLNVEPPDKSSPRRPCRRPRLMASCCCPAAASFSL